MNWYCNKITKTCYGTRESVSREKGIIEKIKIEQPALEKMGYRAVVNRENGMTPKKDVKNICYTRCANYP
jgi:hypothetical protein